MATHIMINGKEYTNPFAKVLLAIAFILVAAVITAVIVFVVLPLIGIAVTLSFGFVAIFMIASIAGFTALVFATLVFGWLFGPSVFRFEIQRHRKPRP